MKPLSRNYTMEEAVLYCNKFKVFTIIMAVLLFLFPFIPPYVLGFDPRIESHLPMFYGYMTVYYLIYVAWLSIASERPRKIRKVIAEKAILLGCPIEISPLGAKAKNSFVTNVKVNEEMKSLLYQLHVEDEVEWQKEKMAVAKPFVEDIQVGSATSARFIGKTVPHYEKARKVGKIPEIPQKEKVI